MEVSAPPEDARLPTTRAPLRLVDATATICLHLPEPIQPVPKSALVRTTPDGRWTALARHFAAGETARCRLCPSGTCCAADDGCLLVVPGRLADEDALMYSTVGLDRVLGDD